jgi:hypothetical protein
MKRIVGWLCDPYLHLLGFGAILLAIGLMVSPDKAGTFEAASPTCSLCSGNHDENLPCPRVIASGHSTETR